MSKCICAIAGRVCPETNDRTKPVYCPAWVVGVAENELDGSFRLIASRTYTGCMIPKLLPYIAAMTAEADHGHAAANQARDSAVEMKAALELRDRNESALREALITSLIQGQISSEGVKQISGEVASDVDA